MKLLGTANAKTIKGEKKGYLTAVMYLAPYNQSGYQVCPKASKGCAAACLYTAGRGRMDRVQQSRIRKTLMFFQEKERFMSQLERDIEALIRKADREDMTPCVRLNGTSDIPWERIKYGNDKKTIFEKFPAVQFYDYTKRVKRDPPPNYHLTFSLSEDNDDEAKEALKRGMNVAVVFRSPDFPSEFWGHKVIDGDETDLRFIDPDGVIVGLKAKGDAKSDTSGFVREV